jgi:hypothetical protein
MQAAYSDQYLDVFDDHLVLKGYYFLKFGQKKIPFSDVTEFKEVRLVYFNGLTRHEQAWFQTRWPMDWKVKGRQECFLIRARGCLLPVGFSAKEPREAALAIHTRLHKK